MTAYYDNHLKKLMATAGILALPLLITSNRAVAQEGISQTNEETDVEHVTQPIEITPQPIELIPHSTEESDNFATPLPYSTQADDLRRTASTSLPQESGLREENTAIAQQPIAQQPVDVPPGQGETISDIQVRFIEQTGEPSEGAYRDHIITREFDLEPGDVYDESLAREGIAKVINLPGVVEASLSLEPATGDEVVMVVTVREGTPGIAFGRHFTLIPGADAERPNALQGTTASPVVRAGPPRPTGFLLPLSFEYFNIGGNDQTLTLGIKPGDQTLGFDLTFRDPWIAGTENRLGYAVNLFALSHKAPAFQNGPNDLDIITDSDPWENRFGGGIQFFRPFSDNFEAAIGLTYQEVSFGDTVFGSRRFTEDEDGNALTVSGDSSDDLLMLTLNTILEGRDDTIFPTEGNRFQFGIDQAIPVGEADILFTRVGANYTQFIPVGLIRVPETRGTFVVNFQGGTIPFDAPPGYEAYVLGGSSSVRGYSAGEVGSPRNYVQGSVEYRFPFASIDIGDGFFQYILGEDWVLAGNIFFDAATGFDSDDTVIGQPGDSRAWSSSGWVSVSILLIRII